MSLGKLNKYVIAAAAVFLLLPFSAFARSKDKDSGSLNVASSTKLGTTELAPGNYKVRWNGTANNVNVDVMQRNKTVATSQAKLIELPKAALNNSVQTNSSTNQIQQIDFSGSREALVIIPKG
jgi:hypothetical protein